MIEHLRALQDKITEWKHAKFPWIQRRYCLTNPTRYGFVVGLVVGSFLVWVLYVPVTPWMQFNWIAATYEPGNPTIYLDGEYEIIRECPELARANPIWRAQAITTEGQVVSYVPGGDPPPMTVGMHSYARTMELDQGSPKDWRVLFIVTCPGEMPETIPSQMATVVIKRELAR